MKKEISSLVRDFEQGRISRRQLVGWLAALAAGAGGGRAAAEERSTFESTGLNHIALRVTDVERSRDFYVEHLGLEVSSEYLPGKAFLTCGENFVALFRGGEPGLHHYCYTIEDYDQQEAAAKLRAVDLEPSLQGGRIYFPDPDGITVQLAAPIRRR
jgi:catechol 2,3-dioxygenase-like lactoylglutathione lyase family enzyme